MATLVPHKPAQQRARDASGNKRPAVVPGYNPNQVTAEMVECALPAPTIATDITREVNAFVAHPALYWAYLMNPDPTVRPQTLADVNAYLTARGL